MRKFKLPNTFVLLCGILAMIAVATWLVPGGKFDTQLVNGKQLIIPGTFHYVDNKPQGLAALMMAPIKGFVDASLIIGFVLIVGGAFAVLQKTEAFDSLIKAIAKAHTSSRFVRAAIIPVFFTMFSLGGATFGMNEEAIPFILIFVPLALALGYDTITGVDSLHRLAGGLFAAFLNPFNVGIAQGIAGVRSFPASLPPDRCGHRHGGQHRIFDVVRGAHQAPSGKKPTYLLDIEKRSEHSMDLDSFAGMTRTHRAVLWIFMATLLTMVVGVVKYDWFIDEIAALFLVMAIVVGLVWPPRHG